MDIEKFKKESKVTYVEVSGIIKGVPSEKNDVIRYKGYITVPFCYNDFKSFTDLQQKAICEAELVKSGICMQINSYYLDSFYCSEDDRKLQKCMNEFNYWIAQSSPSYKYAELYARGREILELIKKNNYMAETFFDFLESAPSKSEVWVCMKHDINKLLAELMSICESSPELNSRYHERLRTFIKEQYEIDIDNLQEGN